VADELADRFGSATWQAVREHLSYVNCDAIPLRVPDWLDRQEWFRRFPFARHGQDRLLSCSNGLVVGLPTDRILLDGGKHQG